MDGVDITTTVIHVNDSPSEGFFEVSYEYENSGADVVITVTDAHRNPYFNMVTNDKDGCSSLVISGKNIVRRQEVPIVYDMTTVAYVVDAGFIKSHNGIFDGKVKSVVIPRERAVDIDDLMDFKVAECLLKEREFYDE